MVNIAILASGSGSNAENIVTYFKDNSFIKVQTIISNNKDAFVLERAQKLGIEAKLFSKNDFETTIITYLEEKEVDFIILAGFLLKVPATLINKFPNRIINIHPALLPKYGGKGMYGDNVHKAVVENREKESGITIHYVNENYDEGKIIFQVKCKIEDNDTFSDVAKKVHNLEYQYFPEILEAVINEKRQEL